MLAPVVVFAYNRPEHLQKTLNYFGENGFKKEISFDMKISVVIATYNGAKYLKEQVDSILSQTLPPYEIIVVDDQSVDNTWEIIQDYCRIYPSLFRVYRNDERVGPHENFRQAFKYATGDVIAPSDQDDIWLPNKLKRSIEVLLETGKDLVFMQDRVMEENGITYDTHRVVTPLYETIYKTFLWGHTCVFKKSILVAYKACPYYAWDSTLGIWCQCHDSIIGIEEIGSIWRRHPGVSTTAYSNNSGLIIENIGTRKKMWKTLFLLSKGKRSEPIRIVMDQETLLINACYDDTRKKELKYYAKIMKHISMQRPLNMLMAGWHMARIVNAHIDGDLLSKMKRCMLAFRTPFVWWYDLKDQKRVGNTEPGYLNR